MKRTLFYSFIAIASCGVFLLFFPESASTQVSGSLPSYVKVQASTPGTPQSGNANLTGRIITGSLTVSTGAANGLVLTSDASGNCTWQPAGFSLPYSGTASIANPGSVFSITNSGTGQAILGTTLSTSFLVPAIYGLASASTGSTIGVSGESLSTDGTGVYGKNLNATGATFGVQGAVNSSQGIGVWGSSSATSGITYGVLGTSASPGSVAVVGNNRSTGDGVYGVTSGTGRAIYGQNSTPTGWAGFFSGRGSFSDNVGIGTTTPTARLEVSGNQGGIGLNANNLLYTNTTSSFVGIGRTSQVTAAEIFGIHSGNAGFGGMYIDTPTSGKGFYGYSNGTNSAWTEFDGGTGNWNVVNGSTALTVTKFADVGIGTTSPLSKLEVKGTSLRGIQGSTTSSDGTGVVGACNFGTNAWGVGGTSASGTGVFGWYTGTTGVGYGFYGQSSSLFGYAAYFAGNVFVAGNLGKSSGSFVIDHPQDPANRYLAHSFVESPDMMNVYNGNVVTDNRGYATVQMPSYFEALNQDFRYQLTVIDANDSADFIMVKVVHEIQNNQFVLRSSKPNCKVSWQVTGIRHDKWAEENRIKVDYPKEDFARGKYLNPEVFGKPATASIHYRGKDKGVAEISRP